MRVRHLPQLLPVASLRREARLQLLETALQKPIPHSGMNTNLNLAALEHLSQLNRDKIESNLNVPGIHGRQGDRLHQEPRNEPPLFVSLG